MFSSRCRRLAHAGAVLVLLMLPAFGVAAAEPPALEPIIRAFFPEADRIAAFAGKPPVADVYADGRLLGHAFLTDQVVAIPAYSGKPISTLVAFDLTGKIRGVRIIRHEEPILVVGIKPADLERFVDQYPGHRIDDRIKLGGRPREGHVTLDGISGATITAMVLNASIMRSVQEVAKMRGIVLDGGAPRQQPPGVEPVQEPLWEGSWRARRGEIIGLLVGLTGLTLIILFQDWLARRPRLLVPLRYGFLFFTLVYLGWIALAQLSVVNVLTFVRAMIHEFQWEAFLIDPILFILWGYVAVALLLWGRGVYCGWLCPFGALQEFANTAGRHLRLPQVEFPELVHSRLWAAKYVIFIMLFGLSLQSLETVLPYAEIEPFKTVFALRLQRDWPFLAYACGLVLVAAFNRKFFCKYLCPLGAALAIPANMKLFDWLNRRKECGHPCQTCGEECEVRAIRATGEINHHECHYCLDCQITYYDAYKCPPLVEKRKRHERHQRRRQAKSAPAPVPVAMKPLPSTAERPPREPDG